VIELTPAEITTLLWHIHTVDLAYGNEPPEASVIAGVRRKLMCEYRALTHEDQPTPS